MEQIGQQVEAQIMIEEEVDVLELKQQVTLISGYSNPPSPSPGTRLTDIEEYNGSSWTSGGTVVTANAEIKRWS